jgi:hypothetical protein
MMIAVYSLALHEQQAVARALPCNTPIVVSSSWPVFALNCASAELAVVFVTPASIPSVIRGISLLARVPILLVVDERHWFLLQGLQGINLETLRLRDLHDDLWPLLARERRALVLRHLSEVVKGLPLGNAAKSAALIAISAEKPFATVSTLAIATGIHRSTLSKEWTQAAARVPTMPKRFSDLLGWIMVLHACSLHRVDQSWASVAEKLAIHPVTLGHIVRERTGHDLRSASVGGLNFAVDAITALLLEPLGKAGATNVEPSRQIPH